MDDYILLLIDGKIILAFAALSPVLPAGTPLALRIWRYYLADIYMIFYRSHTLH